jgi:ArsR family transcriptional regulator
VSYEWIATLSKPTTLADLESRAADAARLLGALANPRRLIVLCRLALDGERTVGELAAVVGLSQSALSQHLAVLREQGIVSTRREAERVLHDRRSAHARADAGA